MSRFALCGAIVCAALLSGCANRTALDLLPDSERAYIRMQASTDTTGAQRPVSVQSMLAGLRGETPPKPTAEKPIERDAAPTVAGTQHSPVVRRMLAGLKSRVGADGRCY